MAGSVGELLALVGSSGVDDGRAPAKATGAKTSQNRDTGAPKSFQRARPIESGSRPPGIPMPGDGLAHARNGLIGWDAGLMSTGVDSVDSQHQELIERINELHAACVAGTAKEEVLKLLGFLGEYAASHFRHEEGVMQEHRCPARGQNKAAHAQFLRDYEGLVEVVKRDGPSTTAVLRIKELLGNWLKNHICAIDTKLRACAGNGSPACKETAVASERDFQDF
jgi:hemerythrin